MSMILKVFLENEAALKRFLSRFFFRAQDIEDLAQETFLRAFAAEIKGQIAAPRAFLYRTAKNLALNERARHANKLTEFMEDSAASAVKWSELQVSADDEIDARQRLALWSKAVASLPPQCGRVFILRKVYGLSHREIAKRLKISPSTVEKHIATGLMKCNEYLRRNGLDAGGRPIGKSDDPPTLRLGQDVEAGGRMKSGRARDDQ